ncbi:DUF305 domain-containing protein [Streptosporangium sp. NPDC023615]|uniref:DUF305 domain-containing protein n=1 Tax=Streptosporangium sp. NPDC023615 TaxID=3154794 RepID=UPI003445BD2D
MRVPSQVIAVIMLVAALAGCAGEGEKGPVPLVAEGGAPVIVPGGPGEAGRTAGPGESLGASEARVTAADVRFAEGMIPHHRQALEMAGLVPSRASSPAVRGIGERIVAAQRPEIAAMTSWLRAAGRPPGGQAGGDGHSGQGGHGDVVTLEQMNRLRTARGKAFDTLFLNLMITHHEAAVTMAGLQLREGTDRAMLATAKDVVSGQGIEITRMRRLLASPS